MYSSGVKRVIDSISSIADRSEGNPVLQGYKTFPFSPRNFMEIQPEEAKLAFVDGGNAEILHSPAFSVFFIRIYFSIFDGGKKVLAKRHEFYALSWADEDLFYKTQFFPLTEGCIMPDELSFSMSDPTIKDGIFAADIAKMGSIIRKFAEWKAACIDAKECIIVKDGTLQAGITNEDIYARNAFDEAKKRNNIVASVAKTSSLFTTTGNNFLAILHRNALHPVWKYHIGFNDYTDVYAAKMHPSSRHVFRIDLMKGFDAIPCIAKNCSDYRFPGYPYGLIDADTFGRITDGEKAYHKTLFLSAMKHHPSHISSGDAHDILNNLVR